MESRKTYMMNNVFLKTIPNRLASFAPKTIITNRLSYYVVKAELDFPTTVFCDEEKKVNS